VEKNTYVATDITNGGGVEYGSDIHGVTIRTNHIVWDMIKILDKNSLFGFHFQTKIASHKTIIIMTHPDQDMLERAKKLLFDFYDISGVLFLAKVKKKKKSKKALKIVLGFSILALVLFGLFEIGLYFYKNYSYYFPTKEETKIVDDNNVTVIKLDIKKLKAIKESFDKENSPIEPKMMKALDITTAIISDMVPPSEKAKYSSKELVKNFKGKGGIKFELDDSNQSADFNKSLQELKSYATNFVKKKKLDDAIKCYNKILKSKEKNIKDIDIANTLSQKANLEKLVGELNISKQDYIKSLEITKELVKHNPQNYIATEAFNLVKLSQVEKDLNQSKIAQKAIEKAKQKYHKGLMKFEKLYKKSPKKYSNDLAWNYNIVANFYLDDQKDLNKSIFYRRKALTLYQKLYKKRPKKFILELFKTTNSLAKTYMKIGNIKQAKTDYQNGFKLISKTKYKEYIALSYHNLAIVFTKNSEFKEALIKYNRAEKLYKLLEQNSTDSFQEHIVQIHYDKAYMYSYQKKFKLAKDSYIKVIQEYKKLNKKTKIYNGKIAKTQNQIAWIYITQQKFRNYTKAQKVIASSIRLAYSIKKDNLTEYKDVLAQSYSYLAHLSLLQNHIDKSLGYYEKSLSIKRKFETDIRYSTLLVAKNSYLKAFRNFELMLKTYTIEEQQAKILMKYGKFYTVIDKNVAKEKIEEAINIYTRLSKMNGKKYEEIESLKKLIVGYKTHTTIMSDTLH